MFLMEFLIGFLTTSGNGKFGQDRAVMESWCHTNMTVFLRVLILMTWQMKAFKLVAVMERGKEGEVLLCLGRPQWWGDNTSQDKWWLGPLVFNSDRQLLTSGIEEKTKRWEWECYRRGFGRLWKNIWWKVVCCPASFLLAKYAFN